MRASDLENYDVCERRQKWLREYVAFRIPPVAALYQGLHAGLTAPDSEVAAKAKVMELAALPGLDIYDANVYDIAVHLAHLAAILAVYLRAGEGPWVLAAPAKLGRHEWQPEVYEMADGRIRRIVLVGQWNDDRKAQEARSWRSVGEICALDREMLLNAIVIGHTSGRRRVSGWTRCWAHPRSGRIRIKRRQALGKEFSGTWEQAWRESSDLTTEKWLAQMQSDDAFRDVVHALKISVPARAEEYRREMVRIADEITALPEHPPMRRSGCYRFEPCVFAGICHAAKFKAPEELGYLRYADLETTCTNAA